MFTPWNLVDIPLGPLGYYLTGVGQNVGDPLRRDRTGVSVPSNVAEGAGRNTKREFINFLHIAQGSLSELDTQLELSRRLEFIDEDTWKWLDDKLIEEDKVLSGLIRSQKEAM